MFCLCLTSKGKWVQSLLFFYPYFCIGFRVRMRQEGGLNYASLIHATAHSAGRAREYVCTCVTVWVWTKCLHRCTDSLEKSGQKQTAWGMVRNGRATVAVPLLARNHIPILKNPSNSRKEYTFMSLVHRSFSLCLSPRNSACLWKSLKQTFLAANTSCGGLPRQSWWTNNTHNSCWFGSPNDMKFSQIKSHRCLMPKIWWKWASFY